MVSSGRRFVYLVLLYTIVEIVVDDVLVFMNLTGRRVPSFTLIVLGALGIDLGTGADVLANMHRIAPLFGVVGAAFVVVAIWHLVSE